MQHGDATALHRDRRRWAARARRAVTPLCIAGVCISALAWHATNASYSGSSATASNSWTTGTVALSNSAATAVLNVSAPIPGSLGSGCVNATYTGSLAATVRLYLKASDLTGALGPYLTLQINQGTGGDSTCTGFVSSGTIYNTTGLSATAKTVSAFSAASNNYATGIDSWSATTNATRTYQFNWQMQDDNTARSYTCGITFTWEAHSA